ncbi:MAG TPA: hypothetical protein PLX85_00025 [Dehalococcoidia bacterium]|nr:hypothetical protein [Dehalococcoidia bacterium]
MNALELRLVGYGLAIAAALGLYTYVHELRSQAARVAPLEALVAGYRANEQLRKEQDHAITKDVAATAAAAAVSALGPVRLCRPAAVPTPAAASPAGPSAGAGAGALPSGVEAGPDIGPQLERTGDEADALIVTARACQAYVRSLPAAYRLPGAP